MGARLSGEAFGELEDDAAVDLDVERAVVEVLIADRHRSEGRQVQRHAASVLRLRIRGSSRSGPDAADLLEAEIGRASCRERVGPYVAGTGAVLRVVPPQAPTFQPNLDAFAQMLTEKVTCVLINTPNNPTGVVYSADTLTRMAAILTEKSAQYGHNIFLVSDEPYRDIVFDGKTVPYPAAFYPHTLTCFSYSKSLSLPGERLGYVLSLIHI